jgi:hypothetical protein
VLKAFANIEERQHSNPIDLIARRDSNEHHDDHFSKSALHHRRALSDLLDREKAQNRVDLGSGLTESWQCNFCVQLGHIAQNHVCIRSNRGELKICLWFDAIFHVCALEIVSVMC